jgi:hypothetical protein
MLSSIEMLNQRVQILEKTYFGLDRSQSQDSILEKVRAVSAKLERVELEVPEFKACFDLVTQFRPLLLEKKNSAVGIMQSVEALLANKEVVQVQMRQLATIGELSQFINNEHYRGTYGCTGVQVYGCGIAIALWAGDYAHTYTHMHARTQTHTCTRTHITHYPPHITHHKPHTTHQIPKKPCSV